MITQNRSISSIFPLEKVKITCRLCNKPAMCDKYICYKKKQGTANCSSCDERLCQHHWRIFFRNNI